MLLIITFTNVSFPLQLCSSASHATEGIAGYYKAALNIVESALFDCCGLVFGIYSSSGWSKRRLKAKNGGKRLVPALELGLTLGHPVRRDHGTPAQLRPSLVLLIQHLQRGTSSVLMQRT
jgi:hypothetical protein